MVFTTVDIRCLMSIKYSLMVKIGGGIFLLAILYAHVFVCTTSKIFIQPSQCDRWNNATPTFGLENKIRSRMLQRSWQSLPYWFPSSELWRHPRVFDFLFAVQRCHPDNYCRSVYLFHPVLDTLSLCFSWSLSSFHQHSSVHSESKVYWPQLESKFGYRRSNGHSKGLSKCHSYTPCLPWYAPFPICLHNLSWCLKDKNCQTSDPLRNSAPLGFSAWIVGYQGNPIVLWAAVTLTSWGVLSYRRKPWKSEVKLCCTPYHMRNYP